MDAHQVAWGRWGGRGRGIEGENVLGRTNLLLCHPEIALWVQVWISVHSVWYSENICIFLSEYWLIVYEKIDYNSQKLSPSMWFSMREDSHWKGGEAKASRHWEQQNASGGRSWVMTERGSVCKSVWYVWYDMTDFRWNWTIVEVKFRQLRTIQW